MPQALSLIVNQMPDSAPDLSKLRIEKNSPKRRIFWGLRRSIVFGGLFSVCLALAYVSYQWQRSSTREIEPAKTPDQGVHPAWVETARAAMLPGILNATGYVVAQHSAAVSSKATGRLKYLGVKEGDLVKRGDVLGVLENDDLQAQVHEYEAALEAAKAEERAAAAELEEARLQFERIKKLRGPDFASQSDLDIAITRVRKAESQTDALRARTALADARLARARTDLDYTFIRTPFDGTILKKYSEVGEIVAPFGSSTNARAAIATVADMTSLQVETDVSEANLSKVYVGQEADIVLDSLPEHIYKGVVDKIIPTVDRAKATVMTKIRFVDLDQNVIPEMSAKVAFKLKSRQ